MIPSEIDRVITLSKQRRASPQDTAFIAEMAGKYCGMSVCVTCPQSVRQAFARVVAEAHKAKEILDRQLEAEIEATAKIQSDELTRQAEQQATQLDFTIDTDCLKCLFDLPVTQLTNEQKIRLINEVAVRTGETIKNCTDCTDDLIRAQGILREHLLNTGTNRH